MIHYEQILDLWYFCSFHKLGKGYLRHHNNVVVPRDNRGKVVLWAL